MFFELLGLRFSPRVRDIGDHRLWRIGPLDHHRHAGPLVRSQIRTDRIIDHWDNMLRVAGSGVEISSRRRPTLEHASTERLFRALLTSAAAAAAAEAMPLVAVIDELQQGPPGLIGPLLTAVHEANQDEIPIGLIAAGLPNTEDWVAQHVTYGGRMFEHYGVALLSRDLAASAYTETLALVPGEAIAPDALDELVTLGQGLPYFIQEFGSALWRTADDDPMSLHDVQRATADGGTQSMASIANAGTKRRARRRTTSPRSRDSTPSFTDVGNPFGPGRQITNDRTIELSLSFNPASGYSIVNGQRRRGLNNQSPTNLYTALTVQ